MSVLPSTFDVPHQSSGNQAFGNAPAKGPLRGTLISCLDTAIFGLLAFFAIMLPHSIKGAERAWKMAFLCWLVKLLLERARPLKQALSAPLLAFVGLTALSTALSPEPYLSWDRMKIVCLVLAGIVVAQNVRKLSQARTLAVLCVLSALTTVLFTAWQYTYGIGVRIEALQTTNSLYQAGIRANDILLQVNGRQIYTADQLSQQIHLLPKSSKVQVRYFPATALWPVTLEVPSEVLVRAGVGTPELTLGRGHPHRAQGTLGHWVVYAEMLMQAGCLAWALMLAAGRKRRTWATLFAVAVAGITWALFLTETRAAIAGLAIGCLLSLILLGRGISRWLAIGAILIVLAGATVWIQRSRGVPWVDRSEISVNFRLLMWEDGLRLIRQHPLFGVGMETVRVHWQEWNIRGFIQYHVQSHFHSTYLQLAVERGVPALLAWLWFCAAYVLLLIRLVRRLYSKDRTSCAIVSGILGGFIAFSLTGLLHYNLGEEPLVMLLFFLYGLAAAIDRISSVDSSVA